MTVEALEGLQDISRKQDGRIWLLSLNEWLCRPHGESHLNFVRDHLIECPLGDIAHWQNVTGCKYIDVKSQSM